MNIPNFMDAKFTEKDGTLTDEWRQMLGQLFAQLQGGLSDEGIKLPQQSASNIAQLAGSDTMGHLVYDSDTHTVKVNINGVFKTIQTL